MAANVGRNLVISKNATPIAGVRTKTVSASGEPIDITSDDDSGYRTFLAEAGMRSMDMSIEGVTKDDILRAAMLTGTTLLLTDITLAYPNGDAITGDFYLASLEESGAHTDAVTFSGSLQSSGAWVYTPAP